MWSQDNDRFQAMAEAMPQIVWTADPDGRVDYYNQRWAEFTGIEQQGGIGDGWRKQLHPEDVGRTAEAWARAVDAAEQYEVEHRLRTAEGDFRWVLSRAVPLKDPLGRVAKWIGTATDIDQQKRAEASRAAADARYRSAVEASGAGTFRWDICTDTVEWDDHTYGLFGFAPGDVQIEHLEDVLSLVHPEDRPQAAREIMRSVTDASDLYVQFRVAWPDGSIHWLEEVGTVIPDSQGAASCMHGALLDITERRRIEEQIRISERRFRAALQNSPVVVFEQDSDLRYTWIHNATGAWDAATVIGKRDADLLARAEDAARLTAIKQRVLETGATAREEVLLVFGGSLHYYDLTVEPRRGPDDEVVGIISAAIDISERRLLEQRLQQEAERLKQADTRKNEFLAMLGHELRNPLAPVRNGIEFLQVECRDLHADVTSMLQIMGRQVQHMGRLLDDLLDVARVTSGRIELRREAADLRAVVRHALEIARPGLEQRALRLELALPDTPVYVDGDPNRLTQIVTNLLDNAVKYTEAPGEVSLELLPGAQGAAIHVRDTGMGIDPDDLPAIFELFGQARQPLSRPRGGLGLGLALARSLAEMHGGRLSAHSDGPGSGAEFVLELPTGAPTPDQLAPECGPALGPARRLLVVDDSRDAADSLAMLLRAMGNEVRTVYDAGAGLDEAKHFNPEVVFLDIGMPKMDGYEAAQAIRAAHPQICIVALTGYGDAATRTRAEDLFDRFLIKPGTLEELKSILSTRDAGDLRA